MKKKSMQYEQKSNDLRVFCNFIRFVVSWNSKFDFYKGGANFSIWFDIAKKVNVKIKSDIYSLSLVWCTAKWSKWKLSFLPKLAYPNILMPKANF